MWFDFQPINLRDDIFHLCLRKNLLIRTKRENFLFIFNDIFIITLIVKLIRYFLKRFYKDFLFISSLKSNSSPHNGLRLSHLKKFLVFKLTTKTLYKCLKLSHLEKKFVRKLTTKTLYKGLRLSYLKNSLVC